MALPVSRSVLVPVLVEAWRLELVAVDHDPGSKALPVIAHDL